MMYNKPETKSHSSFLKMLLWNIFLTSESESSDAKDWKQSCEKGKNILNMFKDMFLGCERGATIGLCIIVTIYQRE